MNYLEYVVLFPSVRFLLPLCNWFLVWFYGSWRTHSFEICFMIQHMIYLGLHSMGTRKECVFHCCWVECQIDPVVWCVVELFYILADHLSTFSINSWVKGVVISDYNCEFCWHCGQGASLSLGDGESPDSPLGLLGHYPRGICESHITPGWWWNSRLLPFY